MTCIVAVTCNGKVWMGADSAGVNGLALTSRLDPKIYRVGQFLLGFTSSFRMGQLLGYQFVPPPRPADCALERYMATAFIDALRATLKAGGYARTKDGAEEAGQFLAATEGRIFNVECDYQVGERRCGFDAVGCGAELALGSLHSTQGLYDPTKRVWTALCAAEEFSAGVRRPFQIEISETRHGQ